MRRTRAHTFLPLFLAVLLGPAGVAAQEPDADRDNCICIDSEPGALATAFFRANRARIGVYLGDAEEVDGRMGVEVMEVEEDGPAEAAGLEDGDIITGINGDPLGDDPSEALVDAIGAVEPGETVEITYYRDGDRRTVEIETDEAGPASWVMSRGNNLLSTPGYQFRTQRAPGGAGLVTPGAFFSRLTSGLELAELNAGLGEYFGTDEGVLVLQIEEGSTLGLQPGDVIRSIDGRDVRDPAHVRAILDSYRNDEAITFQVIRRERTREVTGTLGG